MISCGTHAASAVFCFAFCAPKLCLVLPKSMQQKHVCKKHEDPNTTMRSCLHLSSLSLSLSVCLLAAAYEDHFLRATFRNSERIWRPLSLRELKTFSRNYMHIVQAVLAMMLALSFSRRPKQCVLVGGQTSPLPDALTPTAILPMPILLFLLPS